jgi:hypothetical protein
MMMNTWSKPLPSSPLADILNGGVTTIRVKITVHRNIL